MNPTMKPVVALLLCIALAVQVALAIPVELGSDQGDSTAAIASGLDSEHLYCRSFISMKRTRDSNVDLCVECCKNEFGDSTRWEAVFANKGCYCRPAGQ